MTLVDRITGIEASVAVKAPCKVATTANITLSGEQTINGVAVAAGDRVLVKDQTNAVDNGVWVCSTGAWSRAEDFNGTRDAVTGTQVLAIYGDVAVGATWYISTNAAIVIGATEIAFAKRRVSDSIAVMPQDFGAVGDGVADDGTAINAWADYLRANDVRGYWPGGEYFTGTTTLYLGGVQADCAGSKTNERWDGIGTVVKSNANPIASNTVSGSAGLYTNTVITGLTLAGAGGTVATITLWDYVDYPYQIGWMLGRGPGYVDGGAAVDGYGVFHILDGTVQDVSGWGIYQYEGTGDSTVERVQLRCCGGKAAYELGDDTLGGAILVQANSVDTMYIGCHAINSKNEDGALGDANFNSTGTCVRLGATKTVTDALSRDYTHAINNVHFQNLHSEGYAIGLDVRGTKWSVFSECNINGHGGTLGAINIGVATNPGSSDLRVQFSNCRVASASGITIIHGANVDLGSMVNGTPSTATPISYYRSCKADFLGAGYDQATLTAKGWTLIPKADPVTDFGISSDTTWTPYMQTGALPTSLTSNLFPSFNGGSGTVLTDWTAEGAGTLVVSALGSTVSVVNEKTARYTLTGQTPGDLYTLQFWADWSGTVNLGDLLWKIQDGSDADIHVRAMGSGTEADGSYYHCVQFQAPADGEIRFRFRLGSGAVPANLRAPILQLGAAASGGRALPTQWIAADGMFSTS